MISDFHSAWVAIVGLPNAGKSTLLNTLIGCDLAIVSDKPQTTRNQILGVVHRPTFQILLLDTPGFYEGRMRMDAFFRSEIDRSVSESNVILFLIDGTKTMMKRNLSFFEKVRSESEVPVIVVINKMDRLKQSALIPLLQEVSEKFAGAHAVIPVCARSGFNLEELFRIVEGMIPDGPQFYPEDQITDREPKFLVAEFVREAIFRRTEDEVPFSVGVSVTEWNETPAKVVAGLTIFVEKDGQKGILIGENGEQLNHVRKHASIRSRKVLGKKVELSLWIKVKPGWRKNESILQQVGLK